MRRILLVLTVALIMAAMIAVTVTPAFARGQPPEHAIECVQHPELPPCQP